MNIRWKKSQPSIQIEFLRTTGVNNPFNLITNQSILDFEDTPRKARLAFLGDEQQARLSNRHIEF